MRTYGKKFIKSALARSAKQNSESRDAILWDLLLSDRVARCKVQGSNEYVIARFPQNWDTVPAWCKVGNAVRIAHKGGIRGYIEIVGFGRAIPTPVLGNVVPDNPVPADAIVSGLEICAIPQGARMMVYIRTGVARLDGVERIVPAVSIANGGSLIAADMGLAFGTVAGIFSIAAPAAGKYRIDVFSLGADLVVYKTTGSAFSSAASYPDIPFGHLLIGYLLTRSDQAAITADDIAKVWSDPEASKISASVVDNGATQTITATVKDQWSANISTAGGWTVTAEIVDGDGSLDVATGNTGAGASCPFVYTEGTAGTTVLIRLGVDQGDVSLETYLAIQL